MNDIFNVILIIAIVVGLIESRGWNSTTALFPRLVGIPALGLFIAILGTSIWKGGRPKSEPAVHADSEFARTLKTAALLMSWILSFIATIWIIGINIAIPVYVFSYMKLQGRYGWLLSGVTGLSTGLFVFLVFNVAFRIVWPESLMSVFF